jgi:thioesterase-3
MYTSHYQVKQADIDSFGHMNNAAYLSVYEEARWQSLVKNGLNIAIIKEMGVGPVILEINIKFLKEIKFNDALSIETAGTYAGGKVFKLQQRILNKTVVSSTAEFTMAFFDLQTRKTVMPNDEMLALYGLKPDSF